MSFSSPGSFVVASLLALAVCVAAGRAAGQATAEEAPLLVPVPLVVIVPASETPAVAPSPSPSPSPDVWVAEDAEVPFAPALVSLGASVLVGSREVAGGSAPTWVSGIDLGFRLAPMLAIGVRRLSVSVLEDGDRFTVGLAPYAELTLTVLERIHLYGQAGAALEARVAQSRGGSMEAGVAPFVDVGVRFYPCDVFSIAVEAAAHLPVAGGLSLGDSIAPELAVILQGGLAIAFHFE